MTKNRIKRFTPLQRLSHIFLMVTFLIQSATGLGRTFMETKWGQWLCWVFGGYDTAREVHIWVGIIMLCGFVLHVLYLLFKADWKGFPQSLFGPDSMLPRPADIREFFQHVAWFFGRRKQPEFDRWGYWEKFDYWAVFWGMAIIGITGLMMAYPFTSTKWMPGWGLNVAFWVHRIEAILAMGHIFIIHFFVGHLRRHTFPMDHAMFEGSVDLDAAREERPSWIGRLEESGQLDGALVTGVQPGLKTLYYIVGFIAIAIGVFMLIGALVNAPLVIW
ncbi:Putative cytochrome c [Olavius algarvensis associated proteobacterium Delta 3]|nr:Putative cytochrome c [Olavius algarvensis associated proteobacterium Delta 3]CAB5104425.1 Putative cytochrome c [Olavius algarvensis associated proteobacterium Delta 3]